MQVGGRHEETIFYRLATDQPAYEDVPSLGFRKCDLISKKEKQHCWQHPVAREATGVLTVLSQNLALWNPVTTPVN